MALFPVQSDLVNVEVGQIREYFSDNGGHTCHKADSNKAAAHYGFPNVTLKCAIRPRPGVFANVYNICFN